MFFCINYRLPYLVSREFSSNPAYYGPWSPGRGTGRLLYAILMATCKPCNLDKGKRLEYYKGEGKKKIMINIRDFVKDLPMVQDFGSWLERFGKSRWKNYKESE